MEYFQFLTYSKESIDIYFFLKFSKIRYNNQVSELYSFPN